MTKAEDISYIPDSLQTKSREPRNLSRPGCFNYSL